MLGVASLPRALGSAIDWSLVPSMAENSSMTTGTAELVAGAAPSAYPLKLASPPMRSTTTLYGPKGAADAGIDRANDQCEVAAVDLRTGRREWTRRTGDRGLQLYPEGSRFPDGSRRTLSAWEPVEDLAPDRSYLLTLKRGEGGAIRHDVAIDAIQPGSETSDFGSPNRSSWPSSSGWTV